MVVDFGVDLPPIPAEPHDKPWVTEIAPSFVEAAGAQDLAACGNQIAIEQIAIQPPMRPNGVDEGYCHKGAGEDVERKRKVEQKGVVDCNDGCGYDNQCAKHNPCAIDVRNALFDGVAYQLVVDDALFFEFLV